jgi:hypothetical protein
MMCAHDHASRSRRFWSDDGQTEIKSSTADIRRSHSLRICRSPSGSMCEIAISRQLKDLGAPVPANHEVIAF